jgi:Flp pilus assembly protein protease CpaA
MTISNKVVVTLVLAMALAANGKKTRRPTKGQIEKTVVNKVSMVKHQ